MIQVGRRAGTPRIYAARECQSSWNIVHEACLSTHAASSFFWSSSAPVSTRSARPKLVQSLRPRMIGTHGGPAWQLRHAVSASARPS